MYYYILGLLSLMGWFMILVALANRIMEEEEEEDNVVYFHRIL